MKQILAITPTYFPMMGGAERTVDELYKRLGKYGYETDLVTPHLGGKDLEKKEHFTIYRVGKQTNNKYFKFLLYQWYEYRKILSLIQKKNYDLIHVSYGFPNCFVTAWIKQKLSIPLVITEFHLGTGMDIIDEKQNPWFVNYFLTWIYKKADRITVISNEQKRFVERISHRDDIIVVFQGTDEGYFTPAKYNEAIKTQYKIEGPMFLTVSRLNKRKNIGDQLRAMADVVKVFPTAKLLIAGKGEEREKLEQLMQELNLEKHIIFMGFVSEEKLPELYATADLFLLTSKLEGFGIANAEALASGTPVITYDTKAAGDYITNGETGYITSHNPHEFAKKIIDVLADKKHIQSMSKQARNVVEQKYTWERYTQEHRKVFDEVLHVPYH